MAPRRRERTRRRGEGKTRRRGDTRFCRGGAPRWSATARSAAIRARARARDRTEYRYVGLKAEVADLLWRRLRTPSVVLADVPPIRDDVVETRDAVGAFALGRTLGVGSSASVREARDGRDGALAAIKIVEKTKITRFRAVRRLHNELRLTARVSSPHVSRLLETIHTPERLYFVLEHGGRDLFSYLTSLVPPGIDEKDADAKLEEATARSLIAQLVAGARALADALVVHHDIKTENVLVEVDAAGTPSRLRITDLGAHPARRFGAGPDCGSRPPEAPSRRRRGGGSAEAPPWRGAAGAAATTGARRRRGGPPLSPCGRRRAGRR